MQSPQPAQGEKPPEVTTPATAPTGAMDAAPSGPVIMQAKSRWTPVRWSELPGLSADAVHEAWNAWL